MTYLSRIALSFITLLTMAGGAQAAPHDVAYCAPGFNIALGPGDKATCSRTTHEWVSIGARKCLAAGGGHRTQHEADNGGDMCAGEGVLSMAVGPAVLCEISHPGQGVRTRMVQGGPDQCEKRIQATDYGDIKIRQE